MTFVQRPLVGRVSELAAVRAALSGSRAVLVGGDAGIGKTRVLAELISEASSGGHLVLMGHCLDLAEARTAYLPFVEAFARLSKHAPEQVQVLAEA